MISFELAKALKEAGLPQEGKTKIPEGMLNTNTTWTNDGPHLEIVETMTRTVGGEPAEELLVPSLEELINACGDDFQDLWKAFGGRPNSWIARSNKYRNMIVGQINGTGDSPAEAVARLFIALKGAK